MDERDILSGKIFTGTLKILLIRINADQLSLLADLPEEHCRMAPKPECDIHNNLAKLKVKKIERFAKKDRRVHPLIVYKI